MLHVPSTEGLEHSFIERPERSTTNNATGSMRFGAFASHEEAASSMPRCSRRRLCLPAWAFRMLADRPMIRLGTPEDSGVPAQARELACPGVR
jgi:hypothetical protein